VKVLKYITATVCFFIVLCTPDDAATIGDLLLWLCIWIPAAVMLYRFLMDEQRGAASNG